MAELPRVASNFYHFCKKCEHDRYHKVLAHTDSKTAKIECEVCHSKKTYKLSEGNTVAKKAAGPKKSKVKAEAAASAHAQRYQELLDKVGEKKVEPYRMGGMYNVDTKIEHPKFGVGFVLATMTDKIEVCFSDQVRSLVQNRK
jgi:hypothetical protein